MQRLRKWVDVGPHPLGGGTDAEMAYYELSNSAKDVAALEEP